MHETYITLTEAARRCPHQPHPASCHRWTRHGIRARNGQRIRLKHHRLGGRIYTTQIWLDAFAEAIVAADLEHFEEKGDVIIDPAPSSQARERSVKQAETNLDREGF